MLVFKLSSLKVVSAVFGVYMFLYVSALGEG